jgi:hypothetical protein
VLHQLATGCNLGAAVLSAVAAYYWFRASQVTPPPEILPGTHVWGSHKEPEKPTVFVDTRPLVKFVNDSGQANKTAAIWSAAAAFLWFMSGVLGAFAAAPTP